VVFGFAGSQNNINIWDQSLLLRSFIDGTNDSLDFDFKIGGKTFTELFYLVDGIYPDLSRFVKSTKGPITVPQRLYSGWQEGIQKDIERAFGVLQCKFEILVRKVEYWHLDKIKDMVTCCLILNNMMVENRVGNCEHEENAVYNVVDKGMATCGSRSMAGRKTDDTGKAYRQCPTMDTMMTTSQLLIS
jgi:Plant transposon protein